MIQFEFARPQAIRALTMVSGGDPDPFGTVHADHRERAGVAGERRWAGVSKHPQGPGGAAVQHTLAFPKVTARFSA